MSDSNALGNTTTLSPPAASPMPERTAVAAPGLTPRFGKQAFWVLLALSAATIEPILVKIGYRGSVTPLQLLTYRTLFAAVAMLPLTRTWTWIGWRGIRSVLGVSILLLLTNGLTLAALKTLSAVTVLCAVKTTPALVALFNQVKGRDELTGRFWLGFALCFFGALLTVDAAELIGAWSSFVGGHGTVGDAGPETALPAAGLLFLGGAILSSAVYRTRMETVLQSLRPGVVSTYMFLLDAIFVTILFVPFVGLPPREAWGLSAWTGAAAALANVAFLAAMRLVGSTRMSIFDMMQRPLIIVAAAVVLSEPLTAVQILGIVLVFLGVHLAKVKRRTG